MAPSTAFAKLVSMKQGENTQKKWWLKTNAIVYTKEKDVLDISNFV